MHTGIIQIYSDTTYMNTFLYMLSLIGVCWPNVNRSFCTTFVIVPYSSDYLSMSIGCGEWPNKLSLMLYGMIED